MFQLFDPKTPVNFVGFMPTAVKISAGLVLFSLVLLSPVRGINWGIDFAGGTEMQVKLDKPVDSEVIRAALDDAGFEKKQVQRYGAEENNEVLIRVERLVTIKPEDIAKIEALLEESLAQLAPGTAETAVGISFSEGEGDRITVTLPAPPAPATTTPPAPPPTEGADENAPPSEPPPAPSAEDTALAQHQRLLAQQALLAQLLDEKSGYKLRRTKAAGQAEATTEDAVLRDDPHQGKVKYLVYFQGISSEIEKALSAKLGKVEVRRVDYVDSKVAEQLRTSGVLAVLLAMFCILVYVAVRFDIFFAPGAVVALFHDALVALVLFPVTWREFDLPTIAAVLTVVGYSINNTIVLYDRVREILPQDKDALSDEQLKGFVNTAINQTFSRSINTSLTTLFASVALAIVAGGAVENFALVLSIGILIGAWSSIFIAPWMYLFLRRNFHAPEAVAKTRKKKGLSREEKARGVV